MKRAHVPTAIVEPARLDALALRAVVIASVSWAVVMGTIGFLKFRDSLYTDFDLAIFSQALFGALHGQWFSSIRGSYWLGDHSSPALLVLIPFAVFIRHPLLLVFAQAAALAGGAWPVFALARHRLGNAALGAGFALAWLLQPALMFVALFEFHPESLAVPALLGCMCFMELRHARRALACAAFAVLAREDVALPLFILGVLTLVLRRRESSCRVLGLGLVGIAAGSLFLTFGVLRPLLSHGESDYGAMYAAWGSSPRAIIAHGLAHPLDVLQAMFATPGDPADTYAKRQFWLQLLAPLAALPLGAPLELLPAAPLLLEHLLSWRIEQHTIVYQYAALIVPFFVVAAISAFRRIVPPRKNQGTTAVSARAMVAMGALILAALVCQGVFGPFTTMTRWTHRSIENVRPDARQMEYAVWRHRLMARLPVHGAIVSDFPSLAALSVRDSIHSLHHIVYGTYTFSNRPYPVPARVAGMIADVGDDRVFESLDEAGSMRLAALARRWGLRMTAAAGDLVVLAANTADTLQWLSVARAVSAHPIRFDEGFMYLGSHIESDGETLPGAIVPIVTTWTRTSPVHGEPLIELLLLRPDGSIQSNRIRLLGFGLSPLATWPVGVALEERYSFLVPPNLAPGEYDLIMAVGWRAGGSVVPASSGDSALAADRRRIELGRIHVREEH